MNKQEAIKYFAIEKLKQMVYMIQIKRYERIAYTNSNVGEMFESHEWKAKLEKWETELLEWYKENEELISEIDFEVEFKKKENKIKIEEQREVINSIIGKSYSIEELLEKVS
jgi:hypothetical protein